MDFYKFLTFCGLDWRLYASSGFEDCGDPVWKLHLTNYENRIKFEAVILSREKIQNMKQHLESVFHENSSLIYEFVCLTGAKNFISSKTFDSTTQQVNISVLSGIQFAFTKTEYNHVEEMAIERMILIQKQQSKIELLQNRATLLENENSEKRAELAPSSILKENTLKIGRWIKEAGFQKTTLLYKASTHGWTSQNFHTACDNKGPTLTIILSSSNYIFGGFTPHSWNSAKNYGAGNAHSWLFSLNNSSGLGPIQLHNINGSSQYNDPAYGPAFGSGQDLGK